MKTWKLLSLAAVVALASTALVSCQSDDDWQEETPNEATNQEVHTCPLELNISKEDYADAPQTRSAEAWAKDDQIYLTFTVGSSTTSGVATYDGSKWNISYFGNLTEGTTTLCAAVYIEDAESVSNSNVLLNERSAIYEDTNAQYIYSGGSLTVTANLSPKFGRVRFAGISNAAISVYGITYCTSYDFSTQKYITSSKLISTTVSTTGYTPYIYGDFTDTTSPRLNLITSTSGFTRSLPTNIYRKGESGYITIPSESAYDSWVNALIIPIDGKDLKLLPVEYSNGNFFLAETELTKEMYNAMTGSNDYTTDLQTPVILNNPSSVSSLFSTIKTNTGFSFRVPTVSEWKFAAKGGTLSKGYIYSGSDNLSEVGWYSENSNSKLHDVKQLAPNELGFYDMSGNVREHTSNTSGYWNAYGGAYSLSASACEPTSYYTYSYNSSSGYLPDMCGLRIALSH